MALRLSKAVRDRKLFKIVGLYTLTLSFVSVPTLFANTDSETAADNSKINRGSTSGQSVTAEQQKNTAPDLEITKRIRKNIIKDKSLSTYGHNVKVITENGKVTLKGSVHSEKEKSKIERKAQWVAGAGNVQDQLEVIKKD